MFYIATRNHSSEHVKYDVAKASLAILKVECIACDDCEKQTVVDDSRGDDVRLVESQIIVIHVM
ncbi:hypothetical protein, partial [Stenotrophomonas maltophilia]|uniref:hypothetical protein n=1 Tax=Stenotrophomonas maltophilia TaxID=40324 RepID=UPI0019540577